jgi:phosphate-selective porin OprO/OprP
LDRALHWALASMKWLVLLLVISSRVAFADGSDGSDAAKLGEDRVAAPSYTSGYKDGFVLIAPDGSSKLYIGTITQFDGRFFANDNANTEADQFVFNDIRLDLHGTLFEHYDFRFLPDFAGGKVVVQDAYVDVRYSNYFKIRVGKLKVPFGLERLQQDYATTFAQRGLPNNLVPNRDLGVQLFGEISDGLFAYQVGVFDGVADGGSSDGDATDDKELAARIFVRPFAHGAWWLQNLGVGGAATFGDKQASIAQPDTPAWKSPGQQTIFSYKVGATDTLADTVVLDGRTSRATAQGYWYAGPLGVLSEYVRSIEHVVLNGTHDRITADAWQVIGQAVLTGDAATYNSVTPAHPFDPEHGQIGAIDVVARVGEIRLVDDDALAAGDVDPTKSIRRAWSGSVGADWYLNRSLRFLVNYDHTWFRYGAKALGDRPTEDVITGRVQLAF